jgi:hypothetical protein
VLVYTETTKVLKFVLLRKTTPACGRCNKREIYELRHYRKAICWYLYIYNFFLILPETGKTSCTPELFFFTKFSK